MKVRGYKSKRNVTGIRYSIYFFSHNRRCYTGILEVNVGGKVRSKIMWQNLLQYQWRIRPVCRIKFWLTENRQLRYRFKEKWVVLWLPLLRSGRVTTQSLDEFTKWSAPINSCETPKPDLVDINYSCLNYVIDSGPKLGVTRKGRTDWEEKGDPLKVQSGRAGHAASVRSEAKGCKKETGFV